MTTQMKRSRALHIVLWVAQAVLGGMFMMIGLMKAATPMDELVKIVPMAHEMPVLIRSVGIIEILGGIGLLLPAALRVKPYLTILAAIGIALIMLLAAIVHIARGESSVIGTNIGLGALAVFIAWGRAKKVPIAQRV